MYSYANKRIKIDEESPRIRTGDFGEILHSYTPEQAILEAKRCNQCLIPFCAEACPIAQDARGYVGLISEGKFDEAAQTILQANPLATSLCKSCYHYCETACIRGNRALPVAIRHLKRSALEYGRSDLSYAPQAPLHLKIAVIGGGPAGIMAAWELGIRGYTVTVFEQDELLGGQMGAIPRYRLDGSELDTDVARLRNLDVTFLRGQKSGVDFTPETLLQDGYGAVYVAIGTSAHRDLKVPGEELPGVYPALEFLKDTNRGLNVPVGRRVVVIGGGDVAMDAARTAKRLTQGGEVIVAYRRSREEMPAEKEEVHETETEEVPFLFLHAPLRIIGKGHVEGIVMQKLKLGPPDASGRRAPVPIPGSEVTIACDAVISSVGQIPDLAGFSKKFDFTVGSQGAPEGKGTGFATGVEGVFASGGKSIVFAMAAASRAAEQIDLYVSQKHGLSPHPRPDPFGGPQPVPRPSGFEGASWHF